MKSYYYSIENQKQILKYLAIATFFLGIIGFAYSSKSIDMDILNNSLGLFVAEWNDDKNLFLRLAKFFGITLILFGVLILFFEEYFEKERIKFAQKKPYDLIVGLSEQNVSLLKNNYKRESVIIIEKDKNQKAFANFYSFGNIKTVSTKEILINEEFDKIAKLIHNDYKEEKDILTNILNREWLNTSQHKQDSNKTQAIHLDIKLLAFGLKRIKSTRAWYELLKLNRKKFDSKLENSTNIKDRINNFTPSHFPISFTTTIDKVARAEHNRWSAFHYLNGWQYSPQRNIDAKEHDCLQPFEKFSTDETKDTYKYDLASVYFIPDYLARGGFEIVEKSL
jgi:hypothetical protein